MFDLRTHVRMSERNPLRRSCCPRSVNNREQIGWFYRSHAIRSGLVATSTEVRALSQKIIQQMNSLIHGITVRHHENDVLHMGKLRSKIEKATKKRPPLNKDDFRIRMGENVKQLRIGDIGATRHIGSPSQKNPVVTQNPFPAIIGDEADMLTRLKTHRDKGRCQIQPSLKKPFECHMAKRPAFFFSKKSRHPVIATSGIRINLGERGSKLSGCGHREDWRNFKWLFF